MHPIPPCSSAVLVTNTLLTPLAGWLHSLLSPASAEVVVCGRCALSFRVGNSNPTGFTAPQQRTGFTRFLYGDG